MMPLHKPTPILRPQEVDDPALTRRTRRAFLTALASGAAGFGAWRWLRTRPQDDGIASPFRSALETNEHLARDYFDNDHRAPELPAGSAPPKPRLNGDIGLDNNFDPAKWKLHVSGLAAGDASLTLDNLRALPLVRTTMRLCCIEGWSILVNWGGCRFSDFAAAYPPLTHTGKPFDPQHAAADLPNYIAISTPDDAYYVGLDAKSALHPQTLLAYEIDNQPLTPMHGAPLRLVIPTKYGIKNIKRIGSIRYTPNRPPDYWAQQGYDWYAGL